MLHPMLPCLLHSLMSPRGGAMRRKSPRDGSAGAATRCGLLMNCRKTVTAAGSAAPICVRWASCRTAISQSRKAGHMHWRHTPKCNDIPG